MNGTLPSIEECKLSSMSRPPSQSMMDYTKLTNTDSQSESITDCLKCSSPTSSGEDIKVEPVMDSSDYTGVEPRSTDVNRCEDIERTERKTGYFMSREQKDILTNMKEEKEDWERQSVKMEGEDGVRDEEGLWKKEEKETDEQREGYVNDQVAQTDKLVKNGVISEHGQQEGEDLWSTLVTACLQKQPRVLIRRLEIANSSVPVSSSPHTMTYKRDLGARSPWRQHELLSLRRNRSLRQKKRQVMTRKRKTKGQLERSPKMLPSENGICAEASLISPVIFPRNQNTGQTVELVSQVFGCSQCPFIDTEEVNLNQHIEKVHPEELNTTVRSQQPPSSTHQHPTPPKTLPTPTQSHTGTPGAHTCSQCGKSFTHLGDLKRHQRTHTGERPYHCSQCGKSFSRSDKLKLHQRTHTGERPYRCSQCGKNFTQLIHLKKHQRSHTGECPYECFQCGKCFTQLNNLKTHQRIHTGDCPYHCSQCGKSFTYLTTLKNHQLTHTGERPYLCSCCGKSFNRSGNLKKHQQTHTGEQP